MREADASIRHATPACPRTTSARSCCAQLLETTVEEMSKDASGSSVDLQKILELKGLKKAEMDRMLDALRDASFMSGAGGKKIRNLLNLGS